jgi:hypothetical protein
VKLKYLVETLKDGTKKLVRAVWVSKPLPEGYIKEGRTKPGGFAFAGRGTNRARLRRLVRKG